MEKQNDGMQKNEFQINKQPRLEVNQVPEKRTVEQIISFGESLLAGKRNGNLENYIEVKATGGTSEGSPEADDPVILDTSKEDYSLEEQYQILDWLKSKLGMPLSTAPISSVTQDESATMQIRIFEKEFGTPENRWYIGEVTELNEAGEPIKPLYALWSADMVEDQIAGIQVVGEEESDKTE